jgi:hypothetical protein
MFRQRYSVMSLSFLAVCGLAIVFAAQLQGQQPKGGEKPGPVKDWEFPDAEHHRGGNVGKVFASDYATSKPFDEVWTYYAKKIGYTALPFLSAKPSECGVFSRGC